MIKNFLSVICCVFILSCGRDSAVILGPQWVEKDVEVFVEIRPGIPQVGMNEFLVVATHKDNKPAYQYIVSISIKGTDNWRQSIQDGYSGVYRRAINVNNPASDVLAVKLEKGGDTNLLYFPLQTKVNN